MYAGTSISVTVTGLTAGTTYYAAVYDYNNSGYGANFLTPGATNSFTAHSVPVIAQTSPVSATMSEDGSPTAWVTPTISATDADGNALTWSKTSGSSNGTATVSGTGASPTITYSPTANWSGSDSFVVRVTDVDGYDEITVNVTVNAVNDAPVITGQSALSTNEDTALTIVLGNLTVTDIDNTYPTGFSLTVQSGSNYTFSGNTITPCIELQRHADSSCLCE